MNPDDYNKRIDKIMARCESGNRRRIKRNKAKGLVSLKPLIKLPKVIIDPPSFGPE